MDIANQIKNITLDDVDKEMNKLIKINNMSHIIGPRTRIGNNIVDYFTFVQRLETRGKYNTNFYEFLENIDEFKQKKFIQNMLNYYKNVKNKNKTMNEVKVYKEIYNICISAINIMRPLTVMDMYTKYNTKRALNFCSGWGGSAVAAAALNIEAYYGVEINTDLEIPYDNMLSYLRTKCDTQFEMYFCDAANFDYTMSYDTVFVSPPYYFIEKYKNNIQYESKSDMNERFYKPAFTKSYQGLQSGGYFIINVCREVYDNVLKKLFDEAHETFNLKKSQRQNNYQEMVYVWRKP